MTDNILIKDYSSEKDLLFSWRHIIEELYKQHFLSQDEVATIEAVLSSEMLQLWGSDNSFSELDTGHTIEELLKVLTDWDEGQRKRNELRNPEESEYNHSRENYANQHGWNYKTSVSFFEVYNKLPLLSVHMHLFIILCKLFEDIIFDLNAYAAIGFSQKKYARWEYYRRDPSDEIMQVETNKRALYGKMKSKKYDYKAYNYDKEGKLLNISEYTYDDKKKETEELLLWIDEMIISVRFSRGNGIESISIQNYRNSIIQTMENAYFIERELVPATYYKIVYYNNGSFINKIDKERIDFVTIQEYAYKCIIPNVNKYMNTKYIFELDKHQMDGKVYMTDIYRGIKMDILNPIFIDEKLQKEFLIENDRWKMPIISV